MLDLPPPNLGQRERRFMGAVFLIGSGTVEAYDRLLARLDAVAKQAKGYAGPAAEFSGLRPRSEV